MRSNSGATAAAANVDVISTQPHAKPTTAMDTFSVNDQRQALDARSDSSTTSTLTASSGVGSSMTSYSSKQASSAPDNYENEMKYKPVTNFEPQERINPFDKTAAIKTSALTQQYNGSNIYAASSSTSSSSISTSSISSRINRTSSNIKSTPPPSVPPPAPPTAAAAANQLMSSSYKSNTSYSISELTKESKPSYGSCSSIDSNTRMETMTTSANTTSATAPADAVATDAAVAGAGFAIGVATGAGANASQNANRITGNSNAKTRNEWQPNAQRSASVYSAPAVVNTNSAAALPIDTTSGCISNTSPNTSNGYNNQQTELPSYTRPSYSRSESNASKKSDLDIIFGDNKSDSFGNNGKYTRSSGSLSDAELIFGGPTAYKSDRFGSSKSMSVTSDRHGNNNTSGGAHTGPSYKIYDGIQNAAFSDYTDSPSKISGNGGSNASINTYGSANLWSRAAEEDEELDLK